jgi:hypothetical protein
METDIKLTALLSKLHDLNKVNWVPFAHGLNLLILPFNAPKHPQVLQEIQ